MTTRIELKSLSIVVAGMLACAAVPAFAAERTLSIVDFDSIQVTGNMAVIVTASPIASVRISGDVHDLETVKAEVVEQALQIGSAKFGWGSSAKVRGPIIIYISARQLRSASLNGSGRMTIDHIHAPRVDLALIGPGDMRIARVETETLSLQVLGSGRMMIAGKAAQAKLVAQGSATLDASALAVQDATLTAHGAASITATASRSADATATGSSSIAVAGHPACTVQNAGAGVVNCGQ